MAVASFDFEVAFVAYEEEDRNYFEEGSYSVGIGFVVDVAESWMEAVENLVGSSVGSYSEEKGNSDCAGTAVD